MKPAAYRHNRDSSHPASMDRPMGKSPSRTPSESTPKSFKNGLRQRVTKMGLLSSPPPCLSRIMRKNGRRNTKEFPAAAQKKTEAEKDAPLRHDSRNAPMPAVQEISRLTQTPRRNTDAYPAGTTHETGNGTKKNALAGVETAQAGIFRLRQHRFGNSRQRTAGETGAARGAAFPP